MPLKRKVLILKDFWQQVHNICIAARTVTFSEQLLPTAWEYSILFPITKFKTHKIKSIGNEKCA